MDISKTIRTKKKFLKKATEKEDIITTKKTLVQIILDFVDNNPDCRLGDIYSAYPKYDQAHIRSKIRRLIETHRLIQHLRVGAKYKKEIY